MMSAERVRYFAFGSNMSSARLRARIPEAVSKGAGELPGWRFVCNKRGQDGSAKANIVADPTRSVWGVLFEFSASWLPRLDEIEGGYERITVDVTWQARHVSAQTYICTRENDDHVPFDWYKAHIVNGAEEHDLPSPYIAALRALPFRSPGKQSC